MVHHCTLEPNSAYAEVDTVSDTSDVAAIMVDTGPPSTMVIRRGTRCRTPAPCPAQRSYSPGKTRGPLWGIANGNRLFTKVYRVSNVVILVGNDSNM